MFFKSKETPKIYAVQDGDSVSLDRVPDQVFAEKMLGDGVAIIPRSNKVKSPVNGRIVQVFDTRHAYSIETDDGLEVLVHIGINTVELKGEGFEPKVKDGDRVKVGDVLCEADLDFMIKKGYEIYTPVIITNMDAVKNIKTFSGNVIGGETPVIEYKKA